MASRAYRLDRSLEPAIRDGQIPAEAAPEPKSSAETGGKSVVRTLRGRRRQRTDIPVEIIAASGLHLTSTMVDVSETGIGLAGASGLMKSDVVEIVVPNSPKLQAIVRWTSGSRAGLEVVGARYIAGAGWKLEFAAPDVIRSGWHGWLLGKNDHAARSLWSAGAAWLQQRSVRGPEAVAAAYGSNRRFKRAYRENGLSLLLPHSAVNS